MRGERNLCQVGTKFGRLEVAKRWTAKIEGRKSKETFCECKCECGNSVVLRARYLRSNTRSCGCLKDTCNKDHHAWQGYGEISKTLWGDIVRGCKRRQRLIPFDLTIEQAWELFLKQERKCALSGLPIQFPKKCDHYGSADRTASLDRIDSSKGYTLGNVQWVQKVLNMMKNNMTTAEFVGWCKTVAAFH